MADLMAASQVRVSDESSVVLRELCAAVFDEGVVLNTEGTEAQRSTEIEGNTLSRARTLR